MIFFTVSLFSLNSCSNEPEGLPEEIDTSVFQEDSEVNLIATKSDLPYEWKKFPEWGMYQLLQFSIHTHPGLNLTLISKLKI